MDGSCRVNVDTYGTENNSIKYATYTQTDNSAGLPEDVLRKDTTGQKNTHTCSQIEGSCNLDDNNVRYTTIDGHIRRNSNGGTELVNAWLKRLATKVT